MISTDRKQCGSALSNFPCLINMTDRFEHTAVVQLKFLNFRVVRRKVLISVLCDSVHNFAQTGTVAQSQQR